MIGTNKRKFYTSLVVLIIASVFLSGCEGKGTDIGSTDSSKENVVEESSTSKEDLFEGYRLIEVDGGDLSGHRESNVVVDIGYGDREYWAFTNEYGQLVRVVADEVIPQKSSETMSNGRYYKDEAKVPGVERSDLDEGHVIADSLGGVSNAYNITPQDSTLNRHGDQAYMEKVIRDAGGCTDFEAIITYPNTETMIPSHYSYTYTLKGNVINDSFDNKNPDESVKDTNKGTSNVDKDSVGEYVWKSVSGSKYHSNNTCSGMNPNKSVKVTLEEAENQGLEPCKKCF